MPPLLLHNATLVDGTGTAPEPSAAVLVDDGKITWVGSEGDLPTSTATASPTRIDLAGNTICPGFFDCHVHLGLPGAGGLPSIGSCIRCPTTTFNSSNACGSRCTTV